MFHVPDVRATVEWYESIGFEVTDSYGNESDGLSFAVMSFGSSKVMFSQDGLPSNAHRREVDLYIYTTQIDDRFSRLKDRVDVVEGPHDTFYGMREFIIRDLNRFWLTFAQPSAFGLLLDAVYKEDAELVRTALAEVQMTPETLTAALECVGAKPNPEIAALLKDAGAKPAIEVSPELLESYVGTYEDKDGSKFSVGLKDGKLTAALGEQEPLRLLAIDENSFRPVAFDNYGIVSFESEGGRVTGCVLNHGGHTVRLVRMP